MDDLDQLRISHANRKAEERDIRMPLETLGKSAHGDKRIRECPSFVQQRGIRSWRVRGRCTTTMILGLILLLGPFWCDGQQVHRRQTLPSIGGNEGASSAQQAPADAKSDQQRTFVEASNNLTASVDRLSSMMLILSATLNQSIGHALVREMNGFSSIINESIGHGLVKEMSGFSSVVEKQIGGSMVSSIEGLTRTMKTTVDQATVISLQIDTTAKDATKDLNATMKHANDIVDGVLSQVNVLFPEVKNMVSSTVKSADGWIQTIDGWAIKVIFAAVALTALLSSAIILVLMCCCVGTCCRLRRRRAQQNAAGKSQGARRTSVESVVTSWHDAKDREGSHDSDDGHEISVVIRPHVIETTKQIASKAQHLRQTSISSRMAWLSSGSHSPASSILPPGPLKWKQAERKGDDKELLSCTDDHELDLSGVQIEIDRCGESKAAQESEDDLASPKGHMSNPFDEAPMDSSSEKAKARASGQGGRSS